MPKLTERTELIRVGQAVNVWMLLIEKPTMSIKDACAEIGMDVSTYHRWIRKGEDMIVQLRKFIGMLQRSQIVSLTIAEAAIMDKMVTAAMSDIADMSDRNMALNAVRAKIGELQRTLHALPGIEEGANDFLKAGPIITTQKSRLASIELEHTDDGLTMHVYEDKEIIDITPEQEEPLQIEP